MFYGMPCCIENSKHVPSSSRALAIAPPQTPPTHRLSLKSLTILTEAAATYSKQCLRPIRHIVIAWPGTCARNDSSNYLACLDFNGVAKWEDGFGVEFGLLHGRGRGVEEGWHGMNAACRIVCVHSLSLRAVLVFVETPLEVAQRAHSTPRLAAPLRSRLWLSVSR